jgi:hypothetical protein
VVTRLLTQTRDQVTRIAQQLRGGRDDRSGPIVARHGGRWRRWREPLSRLLRRCGVAAGDLTRQAVKTIADISCSCQRTHPIADLAKAIDDPAARDMAVAAVCHLSPPNKSASAKSTFSGVR